jgi:hypothetical protein
MDVNRNRRTCYQLRGEIVTSTADSIPKLGHASCFGRAIYPLSPDGAGFEPAVPFGTHAFQACPIDRSGTHPAEGRIVDSDGGARK